MTDTDSTRRGREQISALVAAHGAFTRTAMQASELMAIRGRRQFAAHLDHHRAELNVAIGEFGLWAESFGDWARVDVGRAIYPPASDRPAVAAEPGRIGADLLCARENLRRRRAALLAELGKARRVLGAVGLPADEICAYRRVVRLWAGEAIDLVTGVHRLILADEYIHSLGRLRAAPQSARMTRQVGAMLVRQWMADLEEADREGELELAETCGYGDFVESYRATVSGSLG
ncbi:hypothetical protein [Mycobacterium sp.]|uniref:hypothetical protein n=1 Tax=Mycobacterium sp. TaxID=1785 RepID=UPI00126D4C6F|nr:hypothetical protein [Mycobacterium sp.]KAA8962862.1 MAG: hypothetical protein F6Q13_11515 [Mycobacterium sp.]